MAHSKNHSNLQKAKSLAILRSIGTNRQIFLLTTKSTFGKATKLSWLSNSNVVSLIRKTKIHSYTNWFLVVDQRQKESKNNIAEFLSSQQKGVIRESISKAW